MAVGDSITIVCDHRSHRRKTATLAVWVHTSGGSWVPIEGDRGRARRDRNTERVLDAFPPETDKLLGEFYRPPASCKLCGRGAGVTRNLTPAVLDDLVARGVSCITLMDLQPLVSNLGGGPPE